MTCCWSRDGKRYDSGSLIGNVSAFGAVAPRSIPSSRPDADTATATLGSDSLLQASLRISVLMSRSIGPPGPGGPAWPGPSMGPCVLDRPAVPAAPGGSAESTD